MNKNTFFCFFAVVFCFFAQAQTPARSFGPEGLVRCSSTEYENYIRTLDPSIESREGLNDLVQRLVSEQMSTFSDGNQTEGTANILTIPVVVHVIHNGDAYGTGENIRDEQVISQITVLNQDFRRMAGTPGFNNNPVGADVEIEFCLAKRDPSNNPSTGINRVQLSAAMYNSIQSVEQIKPITQWDPNKYMNIWVVNLGGDLLGYAQLPSNSTNSSVASTDGVVIGHRYFGSQLIYPQGTYFAPFNRGRTATHEVGHFLGLYHIWGDNNNCIVNASDSVQDFCPDTPPASSENYGCPNVDSCPADAFPDMVQNYMDYTNDACMNIFTFNQRTRMRNFLSTFQRRVQLLSSNACQPLMSSPEYDMIQGIKLYPNPATDLVNINISSDLLPDSFIVYNSIGQIMFSKKVENSSDLTINTSAFSQGVYFIQITKENEQKTLRFVKN
jgi:hypothetical protein